MPPFISLPQTASGKSGGEIHGLHTTSYVLPMGFPTTLWGVLPEDRGNPGQNQWCQQHPIWG